MSRAFIIYFVLLLCAASAHAQEIPLPDTIRSTTDTLFANQIHALDSIQKTKDRTIGSVATVNNKVNSHINRLMKATDGPSLSLDTLPIIQSSPFHKTDSIRDRLVARFDSLANRAVTHEPYMETLDSLNAINPMGKVNELEGKLASVGSDLQEKLDQPKGKVNAKLGQLRGEAGGEGNLPGDVSLPGVDQADLSEKIPALQSEIPTADFPKASDVEITTEIDPDISFGLKDKLADTGQLPKIEKVQDGLGEASSVTDKVSGYASDAKNIGAGNLDDVQYIDKEIEAKVDMDELSALQESDQILESHKQMLDSLKNQDAFKAQVLAKAREMVAKQIASQQTTITEAVDKLSKHQKRAGTVFNKVKGLPQRPRKEKKPPVIERFIPGFTLQLQQSDLWFVDFNPALRYRIRSIVSVGVGWNERVIFDNAFRFHKEMRVYGVRTFAELSVLKGLWLRADVERMNAFIPVSPVQFDVGERKTVWCYLAGVKKEFTFSKSVTANIQFMYNLYDPQKTSPYFSRFNVRFGFDFPLKEKSERPLR